MKRGPWSEDEFRTLDRLFAHYHSREVAQALNRSVSAVRNAAHSRGLKKSAAFFASSLSGRIVESNKATQFKSGHKTWNKGKRGVNGTSSTRFKPGSKPVNTWVPVGTERIAKDGILERKVSDTGDKNVDWKSVHVLVWEEINGPVPAGKIVIFADGHRRNFDPSNLLCLSRAELMQRNTVHRYPRELKHAMRLVKKLKRAIGERHEKQE